MMMILLLVLLPPLDRYIVRDTPTRITHDTHDTPRARDPRYIPMIPDGTRRSRTRLAWSRGVDSVRRRWMETSTETSHDDDDDDDDDDKGDDDDDLG